jgi:hypothetical protein
VFIHKVLFWHGIHIVTQALLLRVVLVCMWIMTVSVLDEHGLFMPSIIADVLFSVKSMKGCVQWVVSILK